MCLKSEEMEQEAGTKFQNTTTDWNTLSKTTQSLPCQWGMVDGAVDDEQIHHRKNKGGTKCYKAKASKGEYSTWGERHYFT